MVDTLYTNGVIAAKEHALLGEKLFRLAELTAEEAFRALIEGGFGGGTEASSAADAELICAAEEEALDAFIREYAPDRAHAAYFLLPRDFHNMKALVKAKLLSADPSPMLAPMGLETVEKLQERIDSDPSVPWEQLKEATGAEIGAAFERELYRRLFALCKYSITLKKLLVGKVDRINILTALRAKEQESAEAAYLEGGKLKKEQLDLLIGEGKRDGLRGTPYEEFYERAASEKGKALTAGERALDSFEAEFFASHKYELERKEPFLYYVFRRRAEIANVRILLVCLRAGLKEQEIKKRMRAV